MKPLIIVGAGGHGKVAADVAEKCGYDQIAFLDDAKSVEECAGLRVIGSTDQIASFLDSSDFFIAIGDSKTRQSIQKKVGGHVVTLIHPHASISRRVTIGQGSIVMAGAVINSDVEIGEGCIVNTGASVDHDCRIDDYSHVSVGAHIAGSVHIGEHTWIGIGAVVVNNTTVCDNCIVGAGATVVSDIITPGTYIGTPARIKPSS